MAYNWPELSSTSGFSTNLQINGADGFNGSFAPTLQSFFISIGSVENTWNQTASFNTSPGIPITLPITDVHPITITASSDIFSSFNWSSGQLDRLIQLQRTISSTGQLNNDLYRVLYKTSNAIVVIPYHAGIITGVDELSATKTITTWKNGHIKINGFNLGRFRFYWRNQNYANMAVGSYVDNFTNGSTAIIYNPFGDTEFGQIDCSNYGTTFYTSYPNNSLSVLYGKVRTLFNVSGTTEPILTTSPVTGEIDATVTVTSNKSINSLNTAKLDLIPAHSWYGASSITLYSNETTASQNTGNKLNTFTIVDNKVITFKNPSSFHTYIPYLFYDAQQYSNGNIFSFGNNIESNRFYKPLFLDGNNWGTLSSAAPGSFTLTGINITDATSVKINNESLNFVKAGNGSFIQVTTTSNTTSGFVEITSPAGTITSPSIFKIQPVPTISSFTPTSALSGAQVVITGTNFTSVADSTKSVVTSVRFNNSPAVFDEVTSTTIRAFVPSAATGKITVTTSGGTATSESNFTQVYPPTGVLKKIGLSEEILDITGSVYTGYQYYISGGSLDTLISVKFKYTNNSTLYDAVFEKISANTAKVTIPFMNNTTNGGTIQMVLQNAYSTVDQYGNYQLAINHSNINYPTISTYQTTPNNNTTPVTTKIGTNAYFNNANAWEKTTDIYFAKPTTRKDGLTENSEWTKAVAGWFSNNGEWQQFWPSVENAAKKFYKFDWESAGITGLIDVIKVVPDYPNLYLLLANSPGVVAYGSNVEPNSKSIIAKVNMLNGTISFIDVKGARGTNSCHISDIHVSSDSVYAVGYDYTNNFVPESYGWNNIYNDHYMFEPHVRYLRSVGDIVIPGSVSVGDDQLGHFFLRKFKGYSSEIVLDAIVKKYNKNLNLQFSRKISTTLGAIRSYNDILANLGKNHFQAFKSLSIDVATYPFGGSNYFYLQDNGLHEPKITLFNGALYIIFPIVSCDGPTETTSFYSAFPTKVSFVAKKLKPTNLTEYTGETQVRLISANSKPLANVADDLTYESVAQFEFFRGWPTNKKSGFTQYSVFADQQLNGNNKISFNDGFYWNSLQINPDIRNAFLARDGVFNYATIIGDLESGTSDDNKNGMFVGLYAKNDTFEIMCGTESESGKVATTTDVQFSNINSFLENYSSLQPVYTATSFPTSAFTVTETLNDNGGTGFPMTQVCNA